MSYIKSCNVDVVKIFDLRVRTPDNFAPGLYSTLTVGPRGTYGSPLAWEYILLLSDVQSIKNNFSTIVSTSYITLSANIAYVSTFLTNNTVSLSTTLLNQYNLAVNYNTYLQGTLLYEVSNFYDDTNQIKYPSSLSTIVYNYSTISTYIKSLQQTLTLYSTTSTLFKSGVSTIISLNANIQPSLSTIPSQLNNYSTLLTSYIINDSNILMSTISSSIYKYVSNQSTLFYRTTSTFNNLSTFLFSTYSSQYFIYSSVNATFYGQKFSTVQAQFSSISTVLGYEISSVNYLYSNFIPSTLSTATYNINNNINMNFKTINASVAGTYSTLLSTISTAVNISTANQLVLTNINTYLGYIGSLSTGIAQLYYYSSINRFQTFFELDYYYNDRPISTFFFMSTLSYSGLSTTQGQALNYLQGLSTLNTPLLDTMYNSNVSNAYYNIIKEYRVNGIELIDTICNSMYDSTFVGNFGYPSTISTAYGIYSTQVNSTMLQVYKIVVQSERLAIQNSRFIYQGDNQSSNMSTLVGLAFKSLCNEMALTTSTSFNNLLTYTFQNYRSNSEQTINILDQTETLNNTTMRNYLTLINDHTIQDAYYQNRSTLFVYDFSTTQGVLGSTTLGLLNRDSTTIRYYSTISSLSTFYYVNISSFVSTVNSVSFSSLNSSITSITGFNLSTLSTQLTYVSPIASSIALFMNRQLFSSLNSTIQIGNSTLCNYILSSVSNTIYSNLLILSNRVNDFALGYGSVTSNFITNSNTNASNNLSQIYSNSISLTAANTIISSFTTLSTIYNKAPLNTFGVQTILRTANVSPLNMSHYDRTGKHNLLFINSTTNGIIANSIKVSGFQSTILSNTLSTLNLDLNLYQNFFIDIQTMCNASPAVEINITLSTLSKRTQEGSINVNIAPVSANEVAAGRYLNFNNLGPSLRLNITHSFGFLKYKYLAINGNTFLSKTNSFLNTDNIVLPAGFVNTVTFSSNADYIGIVIDNIGNLFMTDINTNSIMKYSITGELTQFVGGINIPYNLAIDSSNTMYTVSFADNLIYIVIPTGVITSLSLVDGNGIPFIIQSPVGIAVDGNAAYLYVSSLVTCIIYQITLTPLLDGTYTTIPFVGSTLGYLDGTGSQAKFGLVFGITIDSTNIMYVSDYGNNCIRKIVIATQIVTTIAGSQSAGNTITYDEFGNPTSEIETQYAGTQALFNKPTGIVVDNIGNLFVCDSGNFAIRRILLNTNDIITISGINGGGYIDGGILSAGYRQLYGITVNSSKTNFYACDVNKIRQIGYNINAITGNSATTINITTLAETSKRYAVTLVDSNVSRPKFVGIAVGDNFMVVKSQVTVTAASSSSGKITYTTSSPHNLIQGQFVKITGLSTTAFNITGIVYSISILFNQFTIMNSATGTAVTGGSGTVKTYFPLISLLASNGTIYQYDVENNILSTFVTLPGGSGADLTIDPNTNILYATSGVSEIYSISPEGTINTLAILYKLQPAGITINTAGTLLYVAASSVIYQINIQTAFAVSFSYLYAGLQQWVNDDGNGNPITTSVLVTLLGAAGGCYGDQSYVGSAGGLVQGFLNVSAGTYSILIGQGGQSAGGWWTGQGQGGYGGGGTGSQYGGSGGGGRSAIIDSSTVEQVTAGGGGGSYGYTQGGVGGATTAGGGPLPTSSKFANNSALATYTGYSGSGGGGGGGYPGTATSYIAGAGSIHNGGKSYTGNLNGYIINVPGGANNGLHANPGQTGNGLVIICSGITVIAGTGTAGVADGYGTAATIDNVINGIIFYPLPLPYGLLYFAEYTNHTIRRLQLGNNDVLTISGTAKVSGSANGIGKNAQFNQPWNIKTDLSGNLYVSEYGNNSIRKIDINSVVVTTLDGNAGVNTYPPSINPDGFVNKSLLFKPNSISFDHPAAKRGTFSDLYFIDGDGTLLRSLYASYANALNPMSTIVGYNNTFIIQYTNQAGTITEGINYYVNQTLTQLNNTLTSYNNTTGAPVSSQRPSYIIAASNAVLDAQIQYSSAQNASTIAGYDYLSIIKISTNSSAQFLSSSYIANVYLSNVSNLFIDAQNQSTNTLAYFTAAANDAVSASDAATAAIAAGSISGTVISNVFNYNGSDQFFVVPDGVTKISIELLGAGGSYAYTGGGNGPEAQGGYVLGDLIVVPGTVYTVVVGGQENNDQYQYGGGGAGSYGSGGSGGGRSALVLAGVDIVTAGGGGGDATYTSGGQGGGLIGGPGYYGAGPGTQYAGGAASGYGAQNGSYQNGGYGVNGGAGGGGGYYGGGGGGGESYSGGGGSSFVANLVGSVINLQGGGAANTSGRVTISYVPSTGGTGVFTPLTVLNCVFWFDATDAATITQSDNNVTSWANKGNNGGSASVGNGTPLTNVAYINGLNTISFSPYTYMNFRSAIGGDHGDVTFFCVTQVTSDIINGNNTLYMLGAYDYSDYSALVAYNQADTNFPLNQFIVFTVAQQVIVGSLATFGSASIQNNSKLYTMRSGYFSGSSGTIITTPRPFTNATYVDGVPQTLDVNGNFNSEYNTASVLYSISGPLDSSQNMGEMLLYNRALTASEIIQVNLYLIAKWGISYIPLFDPSEIPGIVIRSDANSLTDADGTVLSTWTNSGSGGTVTCTGTVNKNILNGRTVVTFNTTQIWQPIPLSVTAYTMFFVGRQTGGVNGRILEDLSNGHNQIFGYWAGYKKSFYLLNDSGTAGDPPYLVMDGSDTQWDLMSHTKTGSPGDYTFNWNGTSLYTGTSAASTPLVYLDINATSEPSDCQVAEIILYDSVLSPSDVAKVEGYLAWKWGLTPKLPVTHAFKTDPPGLPSVSPSLITWFDGNFGLTTTSWTNRGINGGSATLSGVTITTQNGLHAAVFNDNQSYGAFQPIFTGNSRAVFAVYKANSTGNSLSSYLISQLNQQGPYWEVAIQTTSSGDTFLVEAMNGNAISIISNPVNLPITTMAVLAITYDENSSTNSYTTYNGNTLTSIYYPGSYFFNDTMSYLNGAGNSGSGATISDVGMTLCELLIYDDVVSPADATKLQNYLITKWGLSPPS